MTRRNAHEKFQALNSKALKKLLEAIIALEAENTDIDPRCGACGLAEREVDAIKIAIEDSDSAA